MQQQVQHDHEAPSRRTTPADRQTEVSAPERAARTLVAGGTAALQRLGRPSTLPFRARLERSFGADLSDVTVRTGARDEMVRIGAGAATLQDTVVFGNDQPALHEVAHEVTHVLQNRGGSAAARAVSATHDASEREAGAAEARAVSGGEIAVSAAPAAALQLGPLDWIKRKAGRKGSPAQAQPLPPAPTPLPTPESDDTTDGEKWGKTSADLVSMQRGDGGSVNPVHKVAYKSRIAGGSRKGYFKPDGQSAFSQEGNSARAVASSRVDRALGFRQLAREEFAVHGTEKGSVSADLGAGHAPLVQGNYDTPIAEGEEWMYPEGTVKRVDGTLMWKGSEHVLEHDFKNPATQKSLADLQLQDAITGQSDRHGGNIMINTKTGRARGIDNDQAFDRRFAGQGGRYDPKELNEERDSYFGLPQQVDAGTAERLLGMRSKQYRKVVQGRADDPARLDDATVKDAVRRFQHVKKHVKGLKKDGKLVTDWDDAAYADATADTAHGGYLKKAAEFQDMARSGASHKLTPLALPADPPPAPVVPAAAPVVAGPAPRRPKRRNPGDQADREQRLEEALVGAGLMKRKPVRA